MRILFNSRDIKYKKPFGCIKSEEKCTLRVDIPKYCGTISIRLCIFDENGFEMLVPFDKISEEGDYEIYVTDFSLYKAGLYFYYFRVETQESNFSLYRQGENTNIEEGDLWQLTCYDALYEGKNDFAGKVMYQIFPDRFAVLGKCNSTEKLQPFWIHNSLSDTPVFLPDENGKILNNDFFGGNLNGITEKLPYIKELGVGVIYLNPIFMAYSNHRYDTADYKKIDPMLGTEEDFKNLCEKAHELDIKIILDGVFSHTGSNSRYFDKDGVFGGGAVSDENSPYREWYMFESYPDKYTSWWGIDTLPCVNELCPSYMDYIIKDDDSVIAHWLRAGADGFRLDVVDEIPDEFVAEVKKKMNEVKPEAILIGEVWEDASNKISYSVRRKYLLGNELDSVMNYPFRNAIIGFVLRNINGCDFKDRVMTIAENYPKPVLNCLMNMLSTHDTVRILTLLGDDGSLTEKAQKAEFHLQGERLKRAIELEKLAAFLQFTLPGMPCVYYGDEIGMEGYEDPLNRRFFEWEKEDVGLKEFYKKLAGIKNSTPALKTGDISFVQADDDCIVFERSCEEETVYVRLCRKGGGSSENKNITFTYKSDYAFAEIYNVL